MTPSRLLRASRTCGLALILVGLLSTVGLAQVLLDPGTQPRFVNPLPRPGVIDGSAGGYLGEIAASQFEQWLGLVDPVTGDPLPTTVWGYNGSYPGPTIEARTDVPISILWTNELVDEFGQPLPHLLPVDESIHWAAPASWPAGGVPIVTHVHGGHTESASDGLPEAWFTPGFDETGPDFVHQTYNYDNDQEAASIWYHDHALGITRLNVYAGLAGLYLIRDDWEESLNLPSGDYEVPLVLQDRMFTADGELYYPAMPEVAGAPDPSVLPEFFGDFILVNGKTWPYLAVEPRKYRLRFYNGSDSRFYSMWIGSGNSPQGPVLNQIGTDSGLLYAPVPLDKLVLGPGERADVVVDFAAFAGQTLTLRNNAKEPFPDGGTIDPKTVGQLMQFRVSATPVADPSALPAVLRQAPITPPGPVARARQLLLFEGTDMFGRLQPLLGIVDPDRPDLDGTLLWDEEITENPMLDDVEVWEVYNGTMDAHPIHLHLVSFQILSRQKYSGTYAPKEMMEGSTGAILSGIRLRGKPKPPEPNEKGWKDTAIMYPGEVTRIIAKFDREGEYVWHCHILSHEDHEMMRPFYVGPMDPLARTGGEKAVVAASLESNHPNPFNPYTQIGFLVPERGQVQVAVYDATGRLVRKLADGHYDAGRHSVVWDGRNDGGSAVASGIYIYELRTGRIVERGKMTLAR